MNRRLFFCALFGAAALLFTQCEPPVENRGPQEPFVRALAVADSIRSEGQWPDALRAYRQLEQRIDLGSENLSVWIDVRKKEARIIAYEQSEFLHALAHLDSTHAVLKHNRALNTQPEHLAYMGLLINEYGIYNQIGGDLTRLEEILKKAEGVFRTHLYGYEPGFSNIRYFYKQLANLYVKLGEFDNAESLFKESLQYETQFKQSGIASFNDYGSAYLSQGNYREALSIFEAGLARSPKDTFTHVMLLLNRSEALARLDQVAAATLANEQAYPYLTQARVGPLKDYEARMWRGYLENKAIIAEKQGQWAAAAQHYRKAIQPRLQVVMPRREVAAFLCAEAHCLLRFGQYRPALERFQEAYLQFYPGAQAAPTEAPNPDDLFTDKVLAEILEGKARCLHLLRQPAQALAFYERIPIIEAQLRATHTFESSSLMALQRSRRRFDEAVEIAWEAWRTTGNPDFARKAFQFTEMARGALQTKGLAANEAQSLLTPEQQERDKTLSLQLAAAETQLADMDDPNDPGTVAIVQQLRQLKNEQKNFRRDAARDNPAYASALDGGPNLPLDAVKNQLRPGQMLLDYYLIDSAALHVFAFDAEGNVSWRRTEWSAQHQALADSLIRYVEQPDKANAGKAFFVRSARQLAQVLLGPELAQSPEVGLCMGQRPPTASDSALILVPDLILSALSFEALLLRDAPMDAEWQELPYLVRQYAAGYAFSATLLHIQSSITRARGHSARTSLAGFAPSYRDPSDRLDSAEADVRFAARLYRGDAYCREAAAEATFKKVAQKAQVILLSMHGATDAGNIHRPRLRFGEVLPDSVNDNILYANELQAIPTAADLVVMSACFTGDGPLQKGEGTYSVGRAFTIAGVPAAVMSLWRFPNTSSSPLVRDFLSAIKAQRPKDKALRSAKLALLDEGGAQAHPYFWAGIVAAGDMSALEIRPGRRSWLPIGGGAAVLLLILALRGRRRRALRKSALSGA